MAAIQLIGVYKKPFNATLTQSITLPAVTDGYLLITVGDGANVANVMTVTVNGVSVPEIMHNATGSNQDVRAWGLVNPPSGTFNMVVTTSDAFSEPWLAVHLLSDVDQSTPLRATIPTAFSTSSASPRTLASSALIGDLIVDVYGALGTDAITAGAGQTQIHQTVFKTTSISATSYKAATSDGESMSWSWAGASRQDSYAILSFVPSSGGTTAISFTGTIPAQSATVGVPFSLDVSSYFTGTQTPFAYALATGDLTGTGLSRSGSIISGTPASAGDIAGLSISGTDADLNVATSNSFTITVSAGGDVTAPTFTVAPAVSSVTQTGGTATATINETGSIFYVIVPNAESTPSVAQVIAGQNSAGGAPLDSGSATATTTLSDAFTGLTASTAYKACFVARDDESTPNVQASVTVVNFTTAAVPTGTITSEDLSRNNGAAPGVVSLTHIDVRLQSTGALAVRKTGISTDSSSIFSFSDAAITTGSTYIVSWLESGGQFGIAYNVVAS